MQLDDIMHFVKKNWLLTAAAAAVVLIVALFPAATGAAIVNTIGLIGSLALYLIAFAIATAIVVLGVSIVKNATMENAEMDVTSSVMKNNGLESRSGVSDAPSCHSFGAFFTANDDTKNDQENVQYVVDLSHS